MKPIKFKLSKANKQNRKNQEVRRRAMTSGIILSPNVNESIIAADGKIYKRNQRGMLLFNGLDKDNTLQARLKRRGKALVQWLSQERTTKASKRPSQKESLGMLELMNQTKNEARLDKYRAARAFVFKALRKRGLSSNVSSFYARNPKEAARHFKLELPRAA